jgi:hypothetical protein
MLDYSELTIVKNSDGVATALGYPVNSILLQNNKPLFMGGGGKGDGKAKGDVKAKGDGKAKGDAKAKAKGNIFESDQLAVPAGLICMTQTICRDTNEMSQDVFGPSTYTEYDREPDTIPEGLYEQLLALAESKAPKKLSKRKPVEHKNKIKGKNKTHKLK